MSFARDIHTIVLPCGEILAEKSDHKQTLMNTFYAKSAIGYMECLGSLFVKVL
jgi:hypothetical protein